MAWCKRSSLITLLLPLGLLASPGLRPAFAQRSTQPGGERKHSSLRGFTDPFDDLMLKAQSSKKSSKLEAPPRKHEIDCAVVEWQPQLPTPSLLLVCPPKHVFTPLRVYLAISWNKLEDIPRNLQRIVAPRNAPVRIHPSAKQVRALLRVVEKADSPDKEEWFGFNSVTGFSLDSE